ncbi:MAG: class I SAM-dependent methyltransferase [Acidobacteriota bacterium]
MKEFLRNFNPEWENIPNDCKNMKNIQIFEESAQEYDEWFDENKFVYESEVLALRKFIPKKGYGLEVGVGTGRFAVKLGIQVGVEPAKAMAGIARKRGIKVYEARAEKLPFDNESFNFVLIVTTICFLDSPIKALKEVKRILKPGGNIIIGMIDRDSPLGKIYKSKKNNSKFYRYAHFYSVNQVLDWFKRLKYKNIRICQTIFRDPKEVVAVEPIKDGYSEGGFVVFSGQKEIES